MKPAVQAKEFPCLIVPDSTGRPVRHLILGREATIGRDETNDIVIRNPLISKAHAKLIVSNHSVTVFDLGSVNKTRVNGVEVAQAAVGYGDELQFARVKCRLVLEREESAKLENGLSA
jgi:pSer/pThr/pTyr-binding forkhead associated (FHA) protein